LTLQPGLRQELLSLDNIQELARHYGYWAVFVGIALENTGIPIPGETITIVGGFLAGSGELNYWIVLVSAIAGAVFGDNLGYWLGRIGGWSLLLQIGGFFKIQEKQLEKARKQFLQNAPRAVFFQDQWQGSLKCPIISFSCAILVGQHFGLQSW
jgi:membrane protein DedA with SNARE-associated domain